MSTEEKTIVREMRAQNVSASQIWHYLGELVGGTSNLKFRKKDVSNQITKENKLLDGVDVETTLGYFQKKQEDDPEFFFAVESDDNGVVKNILWIDGRARRAYLEFGDVVIFDTTYNTNKYFMPLGFFTGVNHHWQSIVFGCALLRDEKATNFTWLFTTWKEAMYGKAPISIITDQDPAMRVAIQEVFPKTLHRCCKWHVMTKAREKLLVHYGAKPKFKKDLANIVNRSLTVADFERSWANMLKEHKLEKVSHLKTMYASRAEWVPAFFRGTFFANMSTTQRSEGMNAVMKLMVDNHTSIYQFALRLDKLIVGIWQSESDEDCRTINETPKMWSINNMEVEARRFYTRKIYNRFKKILLESSNGVVLEVERDRLYEVNITCHPFIEGWIPETHQVSVDRIENTITCSCKGFEFSGLLCSHAIKVMQHIGMQNLPSKYILRRWTQGANENTKRTIKERCMAMEELRELESMRYATIYSKLVAVGKMASKSGPAFSLVDSDLVEVMNKVSTINSSAGIADLHVTSNSGPKGASTSKSGPEGVRTRSQTAPTGEYIDPPLSKCKGRKRKPQRLKPLVEKNAPKRRTCSKCGEQVGHNLRTCPKRFDAGYASEKVVSEDDASEDDSQEESQ